MLYSEAPNPHDVTQMKMEHYQLILVTQSFNLVHNYDKN